MNRMEDIKRHFDAGELLYLPYEYWSSSGNQKNITVYDNDIAKHVGIEEAVIIRRFIYLWEKLKGPDGVFIVPEAFCEPVGLSIYSFRETMKKWEKRGFIKTKLRGLPLKKFYKVHEPTFALYLSWIKQRGAGKNYASQVAENGKIACLEQEDEVAVPGKILNSSPIEKHNSSGEAAPRGVFGEVKRSFEQIAASRLEAVLRKHRRVTGPVKPKVWQRAIADLLKIRTKEEIKGVILFLEVDDYFRAPYTPMVFSAASFKAKFDALLAARQRMEAVYAYTEELVCTKDEAFILGMLNQLNWPKGSQGKLHACLRKSIASFEPWFKKVRELNKTEEELSGLGLFTERLLTAIYYGGSKTYLLNWFRQVNAVISKWKDWSGDLSQYEWTPRHKLHVTMLEEQSTQLSSHTKHAHALLAAIE